MIHGDGIIIIMEKEIKDKGRLFSKLFISATYTSELNPPILVSPRFLSLIMNQAQGTSVKYQRTLINQILDLFVQRSTNSLLLYSLDEGSFEVENSVLDGLINWMIKIVSCQEQALEYLKKIQYLIAYYRTSIKNLSILTQWTSIAFYEQRFNPIKMMFIIALTKMYYCNKIGLQQCPQNFFYFFGWQHSSGLRTIPQISSHSIKNNICISLTFNHSLTYSKNNHNLYLIEFDKQERIMACIHKNQLLLGYKCSDNHQVFTQKYPIQIMPNRWYRLIVQYNLTAITVKVDKNKQEKLKTYMLKKKQRIIKQSIFGENFHGMMGSMIVCQKAPIQQQYSYDLYPYGFESWKTLKNIKKFTQFYDSILFSCLPFSTFEVRYQIHCFDIFKRNHSTIGENIILFKGYTAECSTLAHGGLKLIIPFFYFARFYKQTQYPSILEQLLQLLLFIIKMFPLNQIERELSQEGILLLLSQHLSASWKLLTLKCIDLIQKIDLILETAINKRASLKHLLWGLKINQIHNKDIINEHFRYILNKYENNIEFAESVFSFTDIIYFMVQNYQDNASNCCLQHYMNESVLSEEFSLKEGYKLKDYTHQLHYRWIQQIASKILESHLKKSIEQSMQLVKSMIRLLLQKYSTCLYLTILKIMKRQIEIFKENRKFLTIFANKSDIIPFLTYLSQKTINCDLIGDIVYLLLVVYQGSDREGQKRKEIMKFLKNLFYRLGQFPKRKKNPILLAVKKGRKCSDKINDRQSKSKKQYFIYAEDSFILNHSNLKSINRKDTFLQAPNSKIWPSLFQTTPKTIDKWLNLYTILRNFMLSIISDKQESKQFLNRVINQDSIELIYAYYQITNIQIKQLIIKDILQNLMINSMNYSFYKSSYWLNKLILISIDQNVIKMINQNKNNYHMHQSNNSSNTIISQIALKIIINIFQLSIKHNDNIGDYYIIIKSIILLRKQFLIQILYYGFMDLLNRKILNKNNLYTLLIMIEFQMLQSKIDFYQLVELLMLILEQLNNILHKHQQMIFQSQQQFKQQDKSIEYLLALQKMSKYKEVSHSTFDIQVNTGILEEEITFIFDNILSKILTNSEIGIQRMVKRYYLIQTYIASMERVIRQLISLENNNNYNNSKQSIQNYQEKQFYFKSLKSKQKILPKYWLDIYLNIIIYYLCAKLCKDNYTDNQVVRMMILRASNVFLKISLIHYQKLWVFIIQVLVYLCSDNDIVTQIEFYNKTISKKFNPILVQLFSDFLKDENNQPLLTIISLKSLTNKEDIKKLIHTDRFKNSITFKNRLQSILKQCQLKNNQYTKQEYLKRISKNQLKYKNLRTQRTQISSQNNSKMIQHLFDQENILQQQIRIKFLHQQERQLRKFHSIWKKLWNNLRIYHKPYGFWMAQKDTNEFTFPKRSQRNFKYIMSKYSTSTSIQPILQAKIVQPWHIIKMQQKQKHKYVTSFNDMMKPNHPNKMKQNNNNNLNNLRINLKNLWKTLWNQSNQNKQLKQYDAIWVQGNIKAKGKIFLHTDQILFCYDGLQQQDSHLSFQKFTLPFHKQTYQKWRLVTILKITKKRYLLNYTAIQITLNTSKCIFLNFINNNKLQEFINDLSKIRYNYIYTHQNLIKNNKIAFFMDGWLKEVGIDQTLTQLWVNRKISTLQYLIEVNKGASRSINDLSQYLVMPWVVHMNQQKQPILRDLSKTLGALGSSERKKILIEKYTSKDPFNPVPAFFYGTHYSSPGVIFNFLIRISPFTQYSKHLQGGKFDIADRLFSSFLNSWKSAFTQVSDVRQLIPQFYYLPEALINLQQHNLGLTQCGQIVNHVEIPPWAANNPYFFIIQMRQILQSLPVSENISKWIDLIFGYKQKGKQAEQALNIYYYLTYENIKNYQQDQDQVHKKSCQAQIVHFGQIPPMIFNKPHPVRILSKTTLINIGFVQTYQLTNSIKQKVIGISISNKGSDMRIIYRNLIQSLSISRSPTILQKSSKFNLQKNQSQFYYILKKQGAYAVFFKNYFLIYGYLTNQFRIYTRSNGALIQSIRLQTQITYAHVNQDQDLILIGCQSGILHIFQIKYTSQNLQLCQIGQQCFPAPILHISQTQQFYTISFGNYVSIYKIVRSLYYTSKNAIEPFIKLFRSFRNNLLIKYSYIITSPLYGIVICDNANIKIYSINGQFLKSYTINTKNIGILKDHDLHDLIYFVQDDRIVLLSTPDLRNISQIIVKDYQQIINNFVIFKNSISLIGIIQE